MSLASPPIDRPLLDRRRRRAAARPDFAGVQFLLEAAAQDLAERLSAVERHFEVAVDLASGGDAVAKALAGSPQIGRLVRIERDTAFLGGAGGQSVVADEEALPLAANSVDLVLSALSLQLTNDTPGVLIQIQRALKPDGLFLAAMLGGETLNELRAALLSAEAELTGGASPRVIPFVEVRDAGALLQRAGFALPVADQDRLTVRYDTMFGLMTDLRAMGMANMLGERSRRPGSRRLFLRAAEIYRERFADPDGRVRASFDIVSLSGWKPHASQQQPLQPGSAKASLAAALNDRSGS
ncbi:methyltransferase domain-containing protein [Aurantimonas sp. MSK8Z-1]|uniref:methyltransferase domain-containing protein n=1 Tax=Mangrovibrevibacter kandeliae TaxID=2968473 RepID=UPI002118BC5C|nr:methyltransferase domain-containing protein [Aurantimonas sp. MSK8Z-1]MCW4116610.1 methyltransferase domain-containing protein [Aurantimonas sp. MSK8Z-1]